MQDLPKIVRERLKATPAPAGHPDADSLTAFAEASLPARERNMVLVHLSRCVDCRDIVALALPATETARPALHPSRTSWLAWPALRWGFVAAGVVAIASVGLVEYRHLNSEADARSSRTATVTQEAKNEAPAPVPAVTSHGYVEQNTPAAAPEAEGFTHSPSVHNAPTAIDTSAAPKALPHLPQRGASFGRPTGGPVQNNLVSNSGQLANQQQNYLVQEANPAHQPAFDYSAKNPQAPPIPASPQAVRVVPPSSVAGNEAQTSDLTLAQNKPNGETAPDDAKGVSRSKQLPDTVTAEVSSAAPMVEALDKDASRQEMPKVTGDTLSGRDLKALYTTATGGQIRWTISPTGSLQRSYDQGTTWQDVNVIAGAIPAASFANRDANAVSVVAKSKKAEKRNKRDSTLPTFRAVSAAGSDVWAGGMNSALYHSVDGGGHWIQVLPSTGGATLTGDVVGLDFPDPQHGKVTTSTPEVWTTSDAGQTWQKQ